MTQMDVDGRKIDRKSDLSADDADGRKINRKSDLSAEDADERRWEEDQPEVGFVRR
jgi:hypothetical protein